MRLESLSLTIVLKVFQRRDDHDKTCAVKKEVDNIISSRLWQVLERVSKNAHIEVLGRRLNRLLDRLYADFIVELPQPESGNV